MLFRLFGNHPRDKSPFHVRVLVTLGIWDSTDHKHVTIISFFGRSSILIIRNPSGILRVDHMHMTYGDIMAVFAATKAYEV